MTGEAIPPPLKVTTGGLGYPDPVMQSTGGLGEANKQPEEGTARADHSGGKGQFPNQLEDTALRDYLGAPPLGQETPNLIYAFLGNPKLRPIQIYNNTEKLDTPGGGVIFYSWMQKPA